MFGYTYLLTDNNNNNNNLALKRGLVRKSGTPTPHVSFFNCHQFYINVKHVLWVETKNV